MKSNSFSTMIMLVATLGAAIISADEVSATAQKQDYIRYAGVGPVVAEGIDVDKLPERARDFIAHHIRDCEVSSVEHEFASDGYQVSMSDGIEVSFTARGEFEEIDAPEGYVLTQGLVRELVPSKCYKNMIEMDCVANVSAIEIDTNGYNVSFAGTDIDSALYDMTGRLVAVYE